MIIAQPDRRLLARFIAAHANAFKGDVLDIGGGDGRYAGLFKHVDSYKRLDVDEKAKPDIVASIEKIPLEDASVDGIICTQVLGDVWDIPQAMNEMSRILKKDGLLLITECLHNELHDEPHDYWRFTPNTYKKLIGEEFEIISLEPRGGYYSMRLQQHIRKLILKHHPYNKRPMLGRLMHAYASIRCAIAEWHDARQSADINERFAIGFNLLARKR